MQTNLINSYIQNKNNISQNKVKNASDEIELITIRKAKPHFDINRELSNRTFIRPLPPKAHLVHNNLMSAPAIFVKDMVYDFKALKDAWKGNANDHQLGKLNDLGLKLGGLGIATYIYSIKKAPVAKGMEFVGLASFLASMSLWPKIFLDIPARIIHGFSPFMQYEDSQGRKKPFFQDNQYLPFDLITDKEINRIGNWMRIPKNMPNRREAVQEKMRQIALQNNTMWMLTAGFATPVMSSLLCNFFEPGIANIYDNFMNKKADKILLDFSSAKKNYKTDNIEKSLDHVIDLYKGRPFDEKIIDRLTEALTCELNPMVADGVKADLQKLFVNDQYKVSALQFKPLTESINKAVLGAISNDALKPCVKDIVPSIGQLTTLFAQSKFGDKDYSLNEMKDIKNAIIDVVESNINSLNTSSEKKIPANTVRRIIKALNGQELKAGPLMKVLTNRPALILDDEAQKTLKTFASKLSSFCAENNALNVFAYKKLASAPDTTKGKFWNDVVGTFVDVLNITPEEIENTRYDRPLVAKLLKKKMMEVASDGDSYSRVIKTAAEKLDKIKKGIQPDNMRGKYIEQLTNSCNSIADTLRGLGFNNTANKIAGSKGSEIGSLLGISKMFVNDNLANVENTFSRFFNTLNFYRTLKTDPNLSVLNKVFTTEGNCIYTHGDKIPREVKEEITAFAEYLSTSGRISDYSVKFEFLRNLHPNMEDFSPLEFNEDGSIKYKYYNPKKLAKNGVFIPSDVNFFKRYMNLLFGGDLLPETRNLLSNAVTVEKMLKDYRSNMMEKVGDLENFFVPAHVVHDKWKQGDREYYMVRGQGVVTKESHNPADFYKTPEKIFSSATPNERSLCVGTPLDELIHTHTKQLYNKGKWLKMFKGFFIGLAGFTILSQFFFGRSGRSSNKASKV